MTIGLRPKRSEVESLAQRDPLTDLHNRRALYQQQTLYWNRWMSVMGSQD